MLSKEQLRHDRINLGRVIKRLEDAISKEYSTIEHSSGEQAWVKGQAMTQRIKYVRQLLLNVDCHQELDSRSSVPARRYLENVRETLDRLESVVYTLIQPLAAEQDASSSYLSLVPIPTAADETLTPEPHVAEALSEVDLIPPDTMSQYHPAPSSSPADPVQDLLPSPPVTSFSGPTRSLQPQGASSVLSASLKTHEELSGELSRMATQLKRNAQHFSESLEQDKSLILSTSEALEKNYDTMTKESVRLKEHTGKTLGTTWMVFGALIAVTVAWVFMFFVIRVT